MNFIWLFTLLNESQREVWQLLGFSLLSHVRIDWRGVIVVGAIQRAFRLIHRWVISAADLVAVGGWREVSILARDQDLEAPRLSAPHWAWKSRILRNLHLVNHFPVFYLCAYDLDISAAPLPVLHFWHVIRVDNLRLKFAILSCLLFVYEASVFVALQ